MKRRYDYKICPFCGAALDIGEKCDCKEAENKTPAKTPEPPQKRRYIIDITKYMSA